MYRSRSLRAFVTASIFGLLSFGFLVSKLRRTDQDATDKRYQDVRLSIKDKSAPWSSAVLASPSPSLATPTPSISHESVGSLSATPNVASPADVALILKTGSNNVWRRLPLHLLTTFANGRIPNYAIYSDAQERLVSGVETVDSIANITHLLQKHDPNAYQIYSGQKKAIQPNTYREQAGLTGDTIPTESKDGNPEGWTLDRHKFMPMLAHAQQTWPNVKWVVYIEDDTYIFWYNTLRWLAQQSHDEVAYHGACSGPSNATFAQGGSGIFFSQALMAKVFAYGGDVVVEKYAGLTARSCCGDILLGDIMRDHGISVNRGEFGSFSFRPEPPWRTRFDRSVWCEPILTFHHLHQQDMAGLAELEEDLMKENRPKVLFRDVYMKMIDPYLRQDQLSGWDNYADLYVLETNGTIPAALQDESLDLVDASSTSEGCRRACLNFTSCFSWRFSDHSCSLDTGVKFGRAISPPGNIHSTLISGWILPRLNETLLSHECWGFRN